ncbi:MAG: hypothetical protein A2Y55_03550 [Actinobacteria bacterium RBG_16_68_12]|nr:MAG: hypothetical protein A2Y55_03550 [Actinobacteria bacterium RBG_16_68_12]
MTDHGGSGWARPKISICLPVHTLTTACRGAIGAAGRRRQVPATGGVAVVARAAADPSAWVEADPAKAAGATTSMKARAKRSRRAADLPREDVPTGALLLGASREEICEPCTGLPTLRSYGTMLAREPIGAIGAGPVSLAGNPHRRTGPSGRADEALGEQFGTDDLI